MKGVGTPARLMDMFTAQVAGVHRHFWRGWPGALLRDHVNQQTVAKDEDSTRARRRICDVKIGRRERGVVAAQVAKLKHRVRWLHTKPVSPALVVDGEAVRSVLVRSRPDAQRRNEIVTCGRSGSNGCDGEDQQQSERMLCEGSEEFFDKVHFL